MVPVTEIAALDEDARAERREADRDRDRCRQAPTV
jgi:hypothetical protein